MSEHVEIVDQFWGRVMRKQAAELARIHPRMADYLRQAPVLVPGTSWHKPGVRASVFRHMCEKGEKLRVVLGAFGLGYVLRQAHPKGFKAGAKVLTLLRHSNPSTLAQQIQRRPNPADQREFWDNLQQWSGPMGPSYYGVFDVIWMAENLPVGDFDRQHIRDFLFQNRNHGLTRASTWAQLHGAVERWNETFHRNRDVGANPDAPLSPFKGLSDSYHVSGFQVVHLNTSRALVEEGGIMRHCVGGYSAHIGSGRSNVFSIRKDDRRKSTLEIGFNSRNWLIKQHTGKANSAPPAGTAAAATAFIAKLNEKPPA